MPEFTVSLYDYENEACPQHVFTDGPYYVERKANDVAIKTTREHCGPTMIAVVTSEPPARGYPKLYRMGRLHRQ